MARQLPAPLLACLTVCACTGGGPGHSEATAPTAATAPAPTAAAATPAPDSSSEPTTPPHPTATKPQPDASGEQPSREWHEETKRRILAHRSDLDRCFDEHWAPRPNKLSLEYSLAADGSVTRFSTHGPEPVVACMEKVFRGIEFLPPEHGPIDRRQLLEFAHDDLPRPGN